MTDRLDGHATAPRRGSLAVRMIVMLLVVGGVAYGVYAFKSYGNAMGAKYMAAMKNPPQTVSTTKVTAQSWQDLQSAVASLRALNGTDLAFETAGIVERLNFHSGEDVQAGTLLASLRTDDLPARIDALRAQERLATITFGRDQKQFVEKAVPQATLDADTASLKNLQAQIAQQQALMDERVIRAPFAGHVGIRQVDLGQYVGPGTPVVTLQALNPIFVDFYLPQQSVQLTKLGATVSLHVDAYPGQFFTGVITAINPRVDTSNRNIQVRATLQNADHRLLPGMYGSVDIASGGPQAVLTIPQTAITYNPYGNTVYVVSDKDSHGASGLFAQQKFVTAGRTRGDQVQVLEGLHDGDVVVTSGQTKLHNDTPIKVNNTVQPASDPHPEPQDQ